MTKMSASSARGTVPAGRGAAGGRTLLTRTRVGYATGDLGISIAYFAVGFFFLFYLTEVVGLSASVAGTIILVGKLWDGVNDPLIGILSDRTRSRHGRKRVYLLYGAVPFAASFLLLWWIPAGAPLWGKVTLGVVLVLVFATTYSLVGVPYQALVAVLTTDYDERTRLVAYKAVFSAVGAIVGAAIALVVSSAVETESALRVLAVGFAVVVAASTLIAAASVRPYSGQDTVDIAPVPVRRYVALALEPNTSTLLGYKALGAVATGVLTAALPFFALHVVGSASAATLSLAAYTVTGAALVPVWNRLTHRFDKRRLVLVSNCAAGAVLIGIGMLASAGSVAGLVAGSVVLGAVMSAYLVIPPSLVPDLVDWYEYRRGERHESVFFGLWMTVHQLGLGVAAFVLGVTLDLSGYVEGADVQGPTAVLGLRVGFGVIPAVFLVLAAVLLQRYRITRGELEEAVRAVDEGTGARVP